MTERLDRIEVLLLSTVERLNETNVSLDRTNASLDRVAAQQARHTDEIDTLLGAVSTNEVACRELRQTIEESNRELGQTAEASNRELRQATEESNQRFEILRGEAISDRQRWQANFDAQIEILRSQSSDVGRLNDRVDNLEQAN